MFRNRRKALLVGKHIDEVWDEIVPAITKIRDELPWHDWELKDLYNSCASGESRVFLREDIPASEFFFVLRPTITPSGRTMFIWLAWSPNMKARQAPLYFGEIEDIAKRNECSSVEFVTSKEDIVEYASEFGYKDKMYTIRKVIEENPE